MSKKLIIALVLLSIFFVLGFSQKSFQSLVKKIFNTTITPLNVEHYLSCDQLPTTKQVKEAIQNHKDTILDLVSSGSDSVMINGKEVKIKEYYNKEDQTYHFDGAYISILLNQYTQENNNYTSNGQVCSDKADILIYFVRPEDKKHIQSVIGKNFYGVPYRMIKK